MNRQTNYQVEYEIEMNRIRKENEFIEMKKYMNELSKRQSDFNIQCAQINLQLQNCQNNIFMNQPVHSFIHQFPIQQPVQNNYTSFYQQPEAKHKFKNQQQIQHNKNECLKMMYNHAKQTIENLITKPFLSYDEQKILDDYKDFVDMIDSRETLQDYSKPFIVKLDSIYKLAKIMNKHCLTLKYQYIY